MNVPGVDFLDSLCGVDRLNKNWSLVRTINYGVWAFQQNPDGNVLHRIHDVEAWMRDKELEYTTHSEGVYSIRNICGGNCKMVDLKNIPVDFWVNVVVPNTNPVDLTKVRYEAYNNRDVAVKDAEDESSGDNSVKTFTKHVTLNLDFESTIDNEPLIVGQKDGTIHHTDVVEMVLEENRYLASMLRGMLKLLPADKVLEYSKSLEKPFSKGFAGDGIGDLEEEFAYYGKVAEKLIDLTEHAQPPRNMNAFDGDLWLGKVETARRQLNEITPKRYEHGVMTTAELRKLTEKD